MLDRDLGIVGTVDSAEGDNVRVVLKGSGLGVPMGRWVKENEVFALVQVSSAAGAQKATRVLWALLQVNKVGEDGTCTGKLFHRLQNPLAKGAGILGYRCIKLGTVKGRVRIRLVEYNTKVLKPIDKVRVQVREKSFRKDEPTKEGTTNWDGMFTSTQEYDHIAFVSVLEPGGAVKAQVPIAMVDDSVVVIPVAMTEESGVPPAVRGNLWTQRIYDSLLVAAELFKELKALVGKEDSRPEAMEKARDGLKAVQDDLDRFAKERETIVSDARSSGAPPPDLGEGD